MKPEDNKPANDLDADLNSIEQVYRSGQAQEPPDMLDQAVLNKAHLAVESKKTGWHFGGFRWVSAFATASVVVVSLALIMQQKTRVPMAPEINGEPASQSESFGADFMLSDDADEIPESEREEHPARELKVEELRLKQSAAAVQKMDLRAAAKSAARMNRDESNAPAPVASRALMPAEQELRDDRMQSRDELARQRGFVAGKTAALEEAVADPDSKEEASSDLLYMADQLMLETEMDAVTVSGSAVMPEPLPPDEWIQRIMRLKDRQQNEEFERELAEFRKVYPDYELPEELGIE